MGTIFQNDDISDVTQPSIQSFLLPPPSNLIPSLSLPPPLSNSDNAPVQRSFDIHEPTNYLMLFPEGHYEEMTKKNVVLLVIEEFFREGYINRFYRPLEDRDTMIEYALHIMENLGIRNTNGTVIQKIPYSLLIFIYLCYTPPMFLVRDNNESRVVGADIILPQLITELRELNSLDIDNEISVNKDELNYEILFLLKDILNVRNLDNSEIKAVPDYFLHFIENLPIIKEM